MRVLICDQESEMLDTVARWFEVDTATSKVTCVDLMRANPFDVVIASERLSDGSGLELLSHVATRWPNTLRVLVIEPARLKLLRGKLAPFRLHATMRYPIEEDELEAVLNRMGELMESAAADNEAEAEEHPAPRGPLPPPQTATKVQKVTLPQQSVRLSSADTRSMEDGATARPGGTSSGRAAALPSAGSAGSLSASQAGSSSGRAANSSKRAPGPSSTPAPSKQTSRSAKADIPFGAPVPPSPAPVRRKLGNYTPLGAPEDEQLRIVEREFDRTVAPLAARAMRVREEATRPRSQTEKLGTLATHLRDSLKRLLKR